jgi:hypothetical protein
MAKAAPNASPTIYTASSEGGSALASVLVLPIASGRVCEVRFSGVLSTEAARDREDGYPLEGPLQDLANAVTGARLRADEGTDAATYDTVIFRHPHGHKDQNETLCFDPPCPFDATALMLEILAACEMGLQVADGGEGFAEARLTVLYYPDGGAAAVAEAAAAEPVAVVPGERRRNDAWASTHLGARFVDVCEHAPP